jgi:hypothetical protein
MKAVEKFLPVANCKVILIANTADLKGEKIQKATSLQVLFDTAKMSSK